MFKSLFTPICIIGLLAASMPANAYVASVYYDPDCITANYSGYAAFTRYDLKSFIENRPSEVISYWELQSVLFPGAPLVGMCRQTNDNVTVWHNKSIQCQPWDWACGYSAGAKQEAIDDLISSNNCGTIACSVVGGDVYQYEVKRVDFGSCETWHHRVTLFIKEQHLWADPGMPEFTAQTEVLFHCVQSIAGGCIMQ